jgi:Protein of unknown function (DUF2975)
MSDPARIARLSQALYWTATTLAWVLPLLIVVTILREIFDPGLLLDRFALIPRGTEVTPVQAIMVAAIAVAALIPLIAALMAMGRLFDRYRQGEILSDGCADDILRIGRAMLFVAAATVLVPTLQVLVLSWNAPLRVLQIGLDQGTLGFLLSAGLLTVIGWAMREAARVKAENEGFV